MKHRYYLPFAYMFATRYKKPLAKLSFIMIFIVPVGISCTQYLDMASIAPFILALFALFSIYEMGYIYNDTFTIKKETTPNYRLAVESMEQIERCAAPLILIRALYAFVAVFLISAYGSLYFNKFFAGLIAVALFFALHNTVRSHANILTYFLLCSAKYTCLPLLFCPISYMPYVNLALAIAFVIPRTLEHASKPKYSISALQGLDFDLFRVKYYAVASCCCMLLWLFYSIFGLATIICLWFFTYRVFCLWYVNRTLVKRDFA